MKKFFSFAVAAMMAANVQGIEPFDSLKSVELQDVQVTSTRASKQTPMAFTDMKRDAIKSVNYGQDVPYLLSLTPSITMTSDAGNGIGYTSLRVRGTDPSRINITANGVPLNDPVSSTVFWVNMGDFASSVQSMQIQRGVGTSTNGSGAFGATLNMQTENIGLTPYFSIDLSGGSYYSHKETLRFGSGMIKGHWGIQGRLSNIGSKGYLDRASTKLNSYFIQAGYFGNNTSVKFITWNGIEETYHAWNYTSKYEQSLYGRRYNSCGEYYDADGIRRYYDGQTDNYHQQNYQLLWNQILSNTLSMNITLHYTKGKGYYEQYIVPVNLWKTWADYGIGDESITNDLISQDKMDNDFFGAIASLNYNDRKRLQATFGGGWNRYDGDYFGRIIWAQTAGTDVMLTPNYENYRNNNIKNDFNIYAKASYVFATGFNAFVDLQYRHVGYKMQNPKDAFGYNTDNRYVVTDKFNFFNPKFGLNWQINDNHRLFASYAIAHKEPVRNNYKNVIDIYGILSEPVKAERLNDLELGYNFQSTTFSAGANFYWMDYKDQFVLTGELNELGEAKTKNLGKSYRLGIELEAAWKPVNWFRWDINATFSKNRVKELPITLDDGSVAVLDDKPLSFSPSTILNNIFTFSYRGFKASIQSQFVGKQYLTNTGFEYMTCNDDFGNETRETIMLDKHFNTNIDLSYTFALKSFGIKETVVGVSLYNVFNSKFDNNGWAAPSFIRNAAGQIEAVNRNGSRDLWGAGFAPSAPFNMMGHLSVTF